jgi:3-deoxy-D-manno-octulosonic-acid transferase
MFLVYSLLYAVTVFILFVPEYLGRPKELRRKWVREKFGYVPERDSSIWVHAVSVGEVGASIRLLKKLRAEYPQSPLILSTITDTGQKVALEKAPEGTTVVYLPFDLNYILDRCLKRTKPRAFLVMETELWPNIFRALASNGVPVLVLNGRISERSAEGYKKISFFMKKVFSYVSFFGMQGKVDAERLKGIGATNNEVEVLGNFKFDMSISREMPQWAASLERPVIVGGSTHKGEEEIILSSYRENIERFPGLKLIIAPRHPQRFGEVEDILKSSGLPYVKRSEVDRLTPDNLRNTGIILLDTVGELSSVYGIADIAIIGKSFAGIGGQNPLEPAFWGKPIICGPHMENFPFIKDFYEEGAAFEVDQSTLAKKMKELLLAPEKALAAGEKAKKLYARNSGAVDRAMGIIRKYLG